MEFKTNTHKLVARICQHCREQRLPAPGQVRTTKLVYLTECEYYGWVRQRLTDLEDWIFWHYGPWSPALDNILKDDFKIPQEIEAESGKFRPVYWKPPEFELPKLKFDDPAIEGVVLGVLEKFAALPYNELLDYVYFETWPMKNVERGQKIDFSAIPQIQRFVDPTSLLPPQVFHKIREKFQQLEVPKEERLTREGALDSELAQLLGAIDQEGEFNLPEGEVFIDEDTKSELGKVLRD